MCVVSMIYDYYRDKWNNPPYIYPFDPFDPYNPIPQAPIFNNPYINPIPKPLTAEEINEFRKLLEKAKQYDEQNHEKNCETESKKKALLEIAEKLGVKIDFL